MNSDIFTTYSDLLKGRGNPNHDERGRFSSGPGGGGASTSKPPKPKRPKKDTAVKSIAAAFNSFLQPGGSSDRRISYGEGLHNFINRAKLTKAQWHALAVATDTPVTRSWSGSKVKERILGRIRSLLAFEYKSRSRDGRSAA
jgi:hypothetical protein